MEKTPAYMYFYLFGCIRVDKRFFGFAKAMRVDFFLKFVWQNDLHGLRELCTPKRCKYINFIMSFFVVEKRLENKIIMEGWHIYIRVCLWAVVIVVMLHIEFS
eukprot:UN01345